jgi:hypothetical protein
MSEIIFKNAHKNISQKTSKCDIIKSSQINNHKGVCEMINYTVFGNKMKGKIKSFSEKVSKGLKKTSTRFVTDMMFGMIASKSCVLSEVARKLKEKIDSKKTEERLARNLMNFKENERTTLMNNYVDIVKSKVTKDTMIIIDPSDVTKPCSPKMECIGTVKDGSTGKFAQGYWTVGAVILSPNNSQPIPIYQELYPCKKQGGEGLNVEVIRCLHALREGGFSADIPRVYDRGGDSGIIFENLHNHDEKFIIRQNHNRTVIWNGKRIKIDEIAKRIVCSHEMKYTGKNNKTATCKIGMTTVIIPRFNGLELKNFKVHLVFCKEWDKEPLVIYTNLDETLERIALRVVKAYLKRWRIEELYAFKKQKLNFEGFRVRSLRAIKNLDTIITCLIGFIALQADKVEFDGFIVSLIVASKRMLKLHKFLKETKFFLHAVLDGMTEVLSSLKHGIAGYSKPPDVFDGQMSFFSSGFLG